ncbi:hydroxyacylglutathione hydrolase [Pseudomonas entomophila]|uniref:Hydroxyacylglutathione hydrolase n=2 Tax=Pseudomonas entomophila TaxID=312306 RepID=GLO2_PSEE4|nr:hydroxyacylglutathione hydrolase [Pseudomonas entomophila]Q1I7T2.1 RecName: Full=Hydroxyacylglutathione hydrolase; AltName: Full=Glyoxalase II; Short=Glx II [Pseudomonas entomophila L48]WMW07942.1 hydroxyacylglutathione hydrolase [Pseudomonas entomophila]CAK16296.1 hydroxyacylglutathione hydrolase GloB [Pseudomonas entomophila L48]
MIQIDALPAFSDNYIWLLQDTANRRCAVVDPGDDAPVLAWLGKHPGWVLEAILVTHHHHDHVGGVEALKHATGAQVFGPANERIPARDIALEDGAQVHVLGLAFDVLAMPGHTLGHIAYYTAQSPTPLLFSGDTLFAAGCGRLFEGTPEQMHHSLQRLAALPEQTQVYCAHEYTLSNLRFARAVEPHSEPVQQRFEAVTQLRADNRISLPSTIGIERQTNPFLRTAEISVKQKADEWKGHSNPTQASVFAALRSWKDVF